MATEFGLGPSGDFPWAERARGGVRTFSVSATSERPSIYGQNREDDFQALKAAAIADLKPKAQQTAAVIPTKDGSVKVLDVRRVDRSTRMALLEAVTEDQPSNNLLLLQKLRGRLDKAGLHTPTVTVRYRNLSVTTNVVVGDTSLPTLLNAGRHMVKPIRRLLGREPPMGTFSIIDNVSGIVHPGVLTLLLGPPGSGKTTLLKSLAGYNRREKGIKVKATELTYNGKGFQEFRVERTSAYISQIDEHYGELTVRETLDFSARCQSAGYRREIIEKLGEVEKEQGIVPDPELEALMKTATYGKGHDASLQVDVTIGLLGLDVCADTVVGNAMLRGISGGQKKRVTTGELVVGPARVIFADEISTGLDSNSTYSIVKSIGNLAHVMEYTVVIGLLQPSPETFDLFDDIILIANGRLPYQGPRADVLAFFESLGFSCPLRRGVADFLQEVTTPSDQHKYWDRERTGKPFHYQTVKMIQDGYEKTTVWKTRANVLATPYSGPPEADVALQRTEYGAPRRDLLRTCLWRQAVLVDRTKVFSVFRTVMLTVMAFFLATIFWRESRDSITDGNYFFSVIFFSLLYQLLGGVAEMHLLVDRLTVMFRQRDAGFYPGWAFALPVIILRLPFSLLEAIVWSLLVYWIVGFSPTVRFLMFLFIIFLINVWSVQMMTLIAAIARDDTIATAAGSFFLLVFINLSGFVLNSSDIPPWWLGGFWANPFAYATRALGINEFTSAQWDTPDTVNGGVLGPNVLAFRGFGTEYWWCWVCIGFIIGTFVCNAGVFVAAITYLPPLHSPPKLTEESLEEMELSKRVLSASAGTPAFVRTEARAGELPEKKPTQAKDVGGDHAAAAMAAISEDAPLPGKQDGGEAADGKGNAVDVEAPASGAPSPTNTVASNRVASRTGSMMVRPSQRVNVSFASGEEYRKKTAIEFTPMVMTFRDVCYSVPIPKDADVSTLDTGGEGPHAGQLRLLKGINGVFRPHVLTALMGASGAGKTTLMDCLAGRKTEGVITGDIRVNGYPKQDRTFARVMGYVEQTDIHLPQTTVEEACLFSASLRLPATTSDETVRAFVSEVMSLVELTSLRGAFVGVPGVSGLSVEQRKRLTLAVELVANPSVVFMDEPTSGLDARAASIVMAAVRSTVDTGRTVVCTIHQPSIDIFQAFDELLLLKPGGRTIFNGAMGDDSVKLIDYFQGIPDVPPIKPRYNPANWMLEVSNPGAERAMGIDFSEIYAQSELAKKVDELITQHQDPKPDVGDLSMADLGVGKPARQFKLLLKRNFLQYWRMPEYNVTRFASTILIGLVFGSLFWRKGDDYSTVAGVLNIMGVLFSSALFLGISNCLTVQHVADTQRTVFYRERAAGLYGVGPFAAAQQLVELPYIFMQSVIYCAIVYWMVWFRRDAAAFFWFYLYFFLTLCYFTFFGVMAVSITPSVAFANILCSFFFGMWNLLCGFLIPEPSIPKYWVWFYYIDPVSWTLYGLIESQLGEYEDALITTLDGVVMTVPQYLNVVFNFKHSMLGPIVAILIAYSVFFIAITVIALYKLNFQSR